MQHVVAAVEFSAAIPFPAWIKPDVFTLPAFEAFGQTFGPFPLRWYALAYMAGLVLAWRYIVMVGRNAPLWREGQARPNAAIADDLLFYGALGVIGGGRLGSVLFYNPSMIWTDPLQILRVWDGGMSFHGGFLGVCLAVILVARAHKVPVLTLGDCAALATPFGLFFGRIANFINGELWGRQSDAPWAVIFPQAGPDPRHPSQLYEAALEGVVLLLILRWASHGPLKALQRPGMSIAVFLLGYGVFRTGVETVREPDFHMPDFPLGLTMGMILSIPMIVIGAVMLARYLGKSTRPETA